MIVVPAVKEDHTARISSSDEDGMSVTIGLRYESHDLPLHTKIEAPFDNDNAVNCTRCTQ